MVFLILDNTKECKGSPFMKVVYRVFSRDVTAAMLVYLNKGMAAIMVYQTNPPGIEIYFYGNQ